jgi:UDP-GlcNAc3NAcA epimerase
MPKILTVIGARPQFIKSSSVSSLLSDTPDITETVVHTGQHFDHNMSAIFFDELGIREPDFSLSINRGSHGLMTGRMLIELEGLLSREAPDVVLVYGDTNTTLAATLAAAKLCIPIAHVEAGLRSFNRNMPEEINRVLTDRVSKWLFAPTQTAVTNLISDGLSKRDIYLVGDVMFDVALRFSEFVSSEGRLISRLGLKPGGYVLATIHRAENTSSHQRLMAITDAFIEYAKIMPVVWPLHPRTRAILQKFEMLDKLRSKVNLIEPVGYLDMVQLEKFSALIATDSGGMQKEAFFHEVPCVTLRDETEWCELVELGWNRVVPPDDSKNIISAMNNSVGRKGEKRPLYGGGNAARLVVDILRSVL